MITRDLECPWHDYWIIFSYDVTDADFENSPFSFGQSQVKLVQSLNSPFFPPHIGAQPGRGKEESRITCMRMLRANQSKITRSQTRRSRQCVAQCLFQLALWKETFLWRWYCRKKHKNVKIEIWFIVLCTLIDNEFASLLFSQTLFSYCVCMLSDFAKVFERKVWRVQVAHLHNAARALSSPSRCFQFSTNLGKDFFRCLWYCDEIQIECGLVWHWWNSTDLGLID